MATTSLSRTMTAGDRDKFTVSAWVKRGILGNRETYWGAYTDASNYTTISFDTDSTLHWDNHVSGAAGQQLPVNYFRDVGAWYHIVTVWDSANATPGDRMKIYINGDEVTSFLVDGNPSSGQDSSFGNSGSTMVLGQKGDSGSYFTGSLAHVHVCDGQAYAASDFGETDATSGIWIAKTSPSVTYGTNGGFYKFVSGATLTDSSGESNNLTLVGGTLTANKDNPDNNFSTGSSILRQGYPGSITIANGNNTITDGGSDTTGLMSTIGVSSGKWYVEFKRISGTNSYIGVCGASEMNEAAYNNELGVNTLAIGLKEDGNILVANSSSSFSGTYTNGDVISVALDMDNDKVYFAKDGAWATGSGAWDSTTFDAAVGAQAVNTGDDTYVFGCSVNTSGTSVNFGNPNYVLTSAVADENGYGSFEYAPPSGYLALCTKNLGSSGG